MKLPALLLPTLAILGCVVHEHRETIPGRMPVTVEGVSAMARARVDDFTIQTEIRRNGVERTPSADDIVAMKQAGASDLVIREMLNAPVTLPEPGQTRVTRYYDTRPAETAFAVGVTGLALWSIFGHRHHRHHVHYYGCGCR